MRATSVWVCVRLLEVEPYFYVKKIKPYVITVTQQISWTFDRCAQKLALSVAPFVLEEMKKMSYCFRDLTHVLLPSIASDLWVDLPIKRS